MNAFSGLGAAICALRSHATDARQRRAAELRSATIAGQPTADAHAAIADANVLTEAAASVQNAFEAVQVEVGSGVVAAVAAEIAKVAVAGIAGSQPLPAADGIAPVIAPADEASLLEAAAALSKAEHRNHIAAQTLAAVQRRVDGIAERQRAKRTEHASIVADHVAGRSPADATGRLTLLGADINVLEGARAAADAEAQPLRAALAETQQHADHARQHLATVQRHVALRGVVANLATLDAQMVGTIARLAELHPPSAGTPPWGASPRLREDLRRLASMRFEL